MSEDREDTTVYQVVVNDEGQHSIFAAGRELPRGWKATGKEGTKAECLAYVDEVWTDMRPRSLQNTVKEAGIGERS
ncbi:MAG TPA: MbtH family NRPS accessory protein [Longimicrobium sp.]